MRRDDVPLPPAQPSSAPSSVSVNAIERQVEVKNWATLDDHRELILYFGVFDKDSGTVQIERSSQAAA